MAAACLNEIRPRLRWLQVEWRAGRFNNFDARAAFFDARIFASGLLGYEAQLAPAKPGWTRFQRLGQSTRSLPGCKTRAMITRHRTPCRGFAGAKSGGGFKGRCNTNISPL